MVSKTIKIDKLGDTKAVAIKKATNNLETVTKNLITRTNNTKRDRKTIGTTTTTFKITLETCKTWTEQNWRVWSGNSYLNSWVQISPKTLTSCKWCKPFFSKLPTCFRKCRLRIRDSPINKKTLPFITQHKILDLIQISTLLLPSRRNRLGSRSQPLIKAKLARTCVKNIFQSQFFLAWAMASLFAKNVFPSTLPNKISQKEELPLRINKRWITLECSVWDLISWTPIQQKRL